MGCGKSTKGKALAAKLSVPFFDSDLVVEQGAGMSISDIFSTYSEEHFRALETRAIRDILEREEDLVLSLGGGAVVREENADLLRKSGSKVVFINTPISVICERLSGDTTRPLFNSESATELYSFRLPFYKACADLVVEDNSSVEEFVNTVVSKL